MTKSSGKCFRKKQVTFREATYLQKVVLIFPFFLRDDWQSGIPYHSLLKTERKKTPLTADIRR